MKILEHGQTQEKTLLFLPCTAEPVWAFAATIALLVALVVWSLWRSTQTKRALAEAEARRSAKP